VVASSLGGDAIVRTLVAALVIPIVLITLAGEIGKRTASPVS
jgi:BASS family bile acid:Na+ symporter